MSRHRTQRTTVRLPQSLLARAKRKAAAEGRTLTSVIEDGLRHVVAECARSDKAKRRAPRISEAAGGLGPGIDISDSAALQEMDDLAYVHRMQRLK